jgi:hypothetical protein
MTGKKGPLDHVKVAAPCSAEWDEMFSSKANESAFALNAI